MPVIEVDTISRSSLINGTRYPMYCGFLNAMELRMIADVPSFPEDKKHHQIASDIFNPPVDQWQRPLDGNKTMQIKQIYSRTDKDNLMANPVLIGIATTNIDQNVKVQISQKSVVDSTGRTTPIENYYILTISYSEDKKPLWILDGQHRIQGMIESTQRNEPVPFVLLYHPTVYTAPFLAEIFTHVTTGATPMQFLHAEWMKYAFRLGKYEEESYEKSMKATIFLCKDVSFTGINNPFHNKIQFNPYQPITGYYAFSFNMDEWTNLIADNFYGRGGTLNPEELAAEIVKIIRAFESVDTRKDNNSKLFSNNDPHKILAEGFLCGILKYLSIHNEQKSLHEWKNFFLDSKISFNRCNWSMSTVRTKGALSSSNGVPSKIISKESFDVAFNDPDVLNGTLLTDYLQGVGASIKITAYQKTAAGRLSNRDSIEKTFSPSGTVPFDTATGGIGRDIIKIESASANCYIVSVLDPNVNPPRSLYDATKRGGLDISTYLSGYHIEIISMSYSGDTKVNTKIRLDK